MKNAEEKGGDLVMIWERQSIKFKPGPEGARCDPSMPLKTLTRNSALCMAGLFVLCCAVGVGCARLRMSEAEARRMLRDRNVRLWEFRRSWHGTYRVVLAFSEKKDVEGLRGLAVTHLEIDNTEITNLTAVAGLPLKHLSVRHSKISDLSPLRGMKLEHLDLRNTKVADLTPLVGMPLRHLDIWRTPVVDMTPVSKMRLHTFLPPAHCTDIGFLAGRPLRKLYLSYCPGITDISPVRGMRLEALRLDLTKVSDITPLRGMPLYYLRLDKTLVSDLSPLRGMPLKSLGLWGCTKVTDLSVVRGMPLEWLTLYGTGVTDLTPLEGLQLRILSFSPENITKGMSAVRDMKSLEKINCRERTRFQSPSDFWQEFDQDREEQGSRGNEPGGGRE